MYIKVGTCDCGGSLLVPSVDPKNDQPTPACVKCLKSLKKTPKMSNITLKGYGEHGEGVHISNLKNA